MELSGSKSIVLSKTFWGVIVQIAAMVALYFKVDIGDQATLVGVCLGVAGSVLAVVGRVKAVKRIK